MSGYAVTVTTKYQGTISVDVADGVEAEGYIRRINELRDFGMGTATLVDRRGGRRRVRVKDIVSVTAGRVR